MFQLALCNSREEGYGDAKRHEVGSEDQRGGLLLVIRAVKTQSPQKVKKKTLMVKLVRCNVFRILDYMNKVECYSYMYPDLKLLMK